MQDRARESSQPLELSQDKGRSFCSVLCVGIACGQDLWTVCARACVRVCVCVCAWRWSAGMICGL